MLDDDKKRYGYKTGGPGIEALRKEAPEVVERMGYEDGGMPTANDRYNAFIESDIQLLKEHGDDYFNSGTGMFKTIKQGLGDSGQGERLIKDLRKVRREMYDDISDEELLNMTNSRIKEAGLKYQISDKFIKKQKKATGGVMTYAEGGSLLADDMVMEEPMMEEPMIEEPMMAEPMMESEKPEMSTDKDMSSDGEMEEDYLDYILDTALTDEEEEMLMSKLEQDGEMSMLFEKVIDVAQEFAGSGPVEGPGSGVSDSIPARLSDGEFVFTAAAVEEIGADNLMAMMKDAEMKAEERQGLAEGGMPEEEETVTMEVQEQKEPKVQIAKATVNNTRGLLDEDEISKGIKSKMMLDPDQRHVRS